MQLSSFLFFTRNSGVAYNRNMNNDAIFKALSDSTRRLILDELSERNEQTFYELTVRLITKHDLVITRQAVAKHLSTLEDAGLVKSEKRGKYRVIIFSNEPLKNLLQGWIE
ncbi:ArsR/SmtB family transcription factor [Cohnella boryungensis]|uniref:ArsR/SmtB family transcription factor n=1 Tax=Cohnella boryungensis TaxID=768479 RepID=A0ABV8S4U8_9BACL